MKIETGSIITKQKQQELKQKMISSFSDMIAIHYEIKKTTLKSLTSLIFDKNIEEVFYECDLNFEKSTAQSYFIFDMNINDIEFILNSKAKEKALNFLEQQNIDISLFFYEIKEIESDTIAA